jgi:hypothetical protein
MSRTYAAELRRRVKIFGISRVFVRKPDGTPHFVIPMLEEVPPRYGLEWINSTMHILSKADPLFPYRVYKRIQKTPLSKTCIGRSEGELPSTVARILASFLALNYVWSAYGSSFHD